MDSLNLSVHYGHVFLAEQMRLFLFSVKKQTNNNKTTEVKRSHLDSAKTCDFSSSVSYPVLKWSVCHGARLGGWEAVLT